MKCENPHRPAVGRGSPPARGAWIEIWIFLYDKRAAASPPARGAWIEIPRGRLSSGCSTGRPPRGGRGLKSHTRSFSPLREKVAPREGGVD